MWCTHALAYAGARYNMREEGDRRLSETNETIED